MKSAGDGITTERGTPQLNIQELGQKQQLTLHEHETQEAFSEHEGEMRGAFSKLEEETQEAFSEHEQEKQQKEGEAEPASGSGNLEGPALPALHKLIIDGNIPPILSLLLLLLLFLVFSVLVANPKNYVTRWPVPLVVC